MAKAHALRPIYQASRPVLNFVKKNKTIGLSIMCRPACCVKRCLTLDVINSPYRVALISLTPVIAKQVIPSFSVGLHYYSVLCLNVNFHNNNILMGREVFSKANALDYGTRLYDRPFVNRMATNFSGMYFTKTYFF